MVCPSPPASHTLHVRSLDTAVSEMRESDTRSADEGHEVCVDILLKDSRVEVVDVHIAEGIFQLSSNDEEAPQREHKDVREEEHLKPRVKPATHHDRRDERVHVQRDFRSGHVRKRHWHVRELERLVIPGEAIPQVLEDTRGQRRRSVHSARIDQVHEEVLEPAEHHLWSVRYLAQGVEAGLIDTVHVQKFEVAHVHGMFFLRLQLLEHHRIQEAHESNDQLFTLKDLFVSRFGIPEECHEGARGIEPVAHHAVHERDTLPEPSRGLTGSEDQKKCQQARKAGKHRSVEIRNILQEA